MTDFQIGILKLVKSALTGESVSIPEDFDWEEALTTAKKHQIIPVIYYGVKYSSLAPPEDTMRILELATFKSVAFSQNQLYALDCIYKAFDENGIDYMPLKGACLKLIYPQPELRLMGDADILIRYEQYGKTRPIMTALGFNEVLESDHELVWDKKEILHAELHKRLIPSYNKDYYEYYGDGWRFARRGNGCRYDMRDEDTYVYLFTHYAKHYRDGGIGIRHMTDLYVFSDKHPGLDLGYIERELEKLRLAEFYKNTEHTLKVWFGGEAPDNMSDRITNTIFGSGSYGTHDTHILSAAVKTAGEESSENAIRKSLFLKRMFPTYSAMASRYKCLKDHPSLLPLMWAVRFLQIPFRRGSIKRNVESAKITEPDKVIAYRKELEAVGLKFNFKE